MKPYLLVFYMSSTLKMSTSFRWDLLRQQKYKQLSIYRSEGPCDRAQNVFLVYKKRNSTFLIIDLYISKQIIVICSKHRFYIVEKRQNSVQNPLVHQDLHLFLKLRYNVVSVEIKPQFQRLLIVYLILVLWYMTKEKQIEIETTILKGDFLQIDYYFAGILVLWTL